VGECPHHHAELQVSTCSGYDLGRSWFTQMDTHRGAQLVTGCTVSSASYANRSVE